MRLSDDDPIWEQHSGGDGHRWQEWGTGDGSRAVEFYSSVPEKARLIFDLLMDHPGEQMDAEQIAAQISGRGYGGTSGLARHDVAGSLNGTGQLAMALGRRMPLYWWKGRDGSASRYAMKSAVATLFREARRQAGLRPSDATAGSDWTAAEVAAIVDDYLEMLATEVKGERYSKTEHRRALRERLSPNRSKSAIEYKHQNISAVMVTLGLPYIGGYKPMGNFQDALSTEIRRRLHADPALLRQLRTGPADAPPAGPLLREDPPQRVAGSRERASAGNRAGRAPDYGLLHDENMKRGEAGERLVVEYERAQLREQGRDDLAERVRWTSHEDGDGLGYDVLSFSPDGSERYIEVKATSLGALTPFYLSSAELEFARSHLECYALYRVYAVLANPPKFFELQGKEVLQLDLVPVTYRACLPARTSLVAPT